MGSGWSLGDAGKMGLCRKLFQILCGLRRTDFFDVNVSISTLCPCIICGKDLTPALLSESAYILTDVVKKSIASPEVALWNLSVDRPKLVGRECSLGVAACKNNKKMVAVQIPISKSLLGNGQTDVGGSRLKHFSHIVSLLQKSSHAYYHFVAEGLPKLIWLSAVLVCVQR